MATCVRFANGNKKDSSQYYPIFKGRKRKTWTTRPLVESGVESVQYSLIPGLLSVEIKQIKLLPRTRAPGSISLVGENLCQIFRRVGGYQAVFASGTIYHIEMEFRLDHDPNPATVLLSKPGTIVSDRKISGSSRKTIRRFLELVGFCSRDEIPATTGLQALFSWLSRVQSPTMTERDFADTLGVPVLNALKTHHILEDYDIVRQVLCDRIKDHCCEQVIETNTGDIQYPYIARCSRTDRVVPLCMTEVRRLTTSQSSYLNLLKRRFRVAGTINVSPTVVEGFSVTHLGRAKWRGRDTKIYYCQKSWSPLLPYFLQNRLGIEDNTLVLSPSRWVASHSIQNQYNSNCRVELGYLDEMLELVDGDLLLVSKYDFFEEQTLKISDVPYALVIDKHGRHEVNKKEYDRIVNVKEDYDVYLNLKETVAGKYEGGVAHDGEWRLRHLSDLPAGIVANMILNQGHFLGPKKLCPDGEDGESARKAVERARRVFDVRIASPLNGSRGIVYKNFHTKNGRYCFLPPPEENFILISPIHLT